MRSHAKAMSADGFPQQLARRASVVGLEVAPGLVSQLDVYYRLLARWNHTINLTALRLDPISDRAIDRLIVEPLAAASAMAGAQDWIDLGSGGGSPAIPMKLANPAPRLTMVESKERKAAFLREVIRVLAIGSASVETTRIEALRFNSGFGPADLITVRAVRLDLRLFKSISRLLDPGGRVMLFGAHADLPTPVGFRLVDPSSSSTQGPRLKVLVKTISGGR